MFKTKCTYSKLRFMTDAAGSGEGSESGQGGGSTATATATAPKPSDPNTAPSNQGDQSKQETPEQMIARLQGDVDRLNREKDAVRVEKEGTLKREAQRKQLVDLAGVIGVEVGKDDTLEQLTEKLTGKVIQGDQKSQERDTELAQARQRLAVLEVAAEDDVKVDAKKLNNRVSFRDAASKLDQTSSDYSAQLKALIQAEAQNDPSIKVSGGTSTSGADSYGGSGGDQAVTPEQFSKMGIPERTKLKNANPALYERLAFGD